MASFCQFSKYEKSEIYILLAAWSGHCSSTLNNEETSYTKHVLLDTLYWSQCEWH